MPQIDQIPWLGIKSRVHGETERGSAGRNIWLIELFGFVFVVTLCLYWVDSNEGHDSDHPLS